MSTPQARPDALFAAIDPLVRSGTLTPPQAEQVYSAVRASAPPTSDPEDRRRFVLDVHQTALAAAIFATSLVVAGIGVTSSLGDDGFQAKIFWPMLALSVALALAAALSYLTSEVDVLSRVITGTLTTLALISLTGTIGRASTADWVVYILGLVLLLAGAAGYWFLRQDLLVIPTALGALILLVQLSSDTFLDSTSDSGSGEVLAIGLLVVLLGVVIAAAGWRFECRHFTGLIGAILAVGAMVTVVVVLGIVYAIARAFGGVTLDDSESGVSSDVPSASDIHGDIIIALIVGLVVCLVLAALYAATHYRGYAVVGFAGGLLLPWMGTLFVATDHPLRTGLLWALAGGLVVAAVVLWRFWQSPRRQQLMAGNAPHPYPPAGAAGYAPSPQMPQPQAQPQPGPPSDTLSFGNHRAERPSESL